MALESLINPKRAVEKPWEMFFIGFLYSTVAVFLSVWIFKAYSSLIMVLLTVIASVPFMYKTMKIQEKVDIKLKKETAILKRHSEVIKYLLFLFGGFVVAYSIWFIALPSTTVQSLFSSQLETIGTINSKIMGEAISSSSIFFQIFLNNFKVLLFAIFFAFFYGAGAIFILTWNASVIAAAVGSFVKEKIAIYAASVGSASMFNYFHIFSLGILRYSIHGIPEIAAYFIGGLAGSIISVAVINRDLEGVHYKKIMSDVIHLTLIAIGILVLAALLEVYVTPIFF
tara:strand:- start:156 stop:1007 length:852 start_codon:yes stop_codon:yes gene_type:complete